MQIALFEKKPASSTWNFRVFEFSHFCEFRSSAYLEEFAPLSPSPLHSASPLN